MFHVFQATGRLPAELNRFVGREGELAEVERLLARFRLVTVTGVGGVGKTRLALTLGGLVGQSVVLREETPAGMRYRLLDTVRAYGAQWLAALGDEERMRRRHRDWYMGLATWCEVEWFSPRQAEVAACADGAPPDLRAALELCLEVPDEAHLAQHLAAKLGAERFRAYVAEGGALSLDAAVERALSGRPCAGAPEGGGAAACRAGRCGCVGGGRPPGGAPPGPAPRDRRS